MWKLHGRTYPHGDRIIWCTLLLHKEERRLYMLTYNEVERCAMFRDNKHLTTLHILHRI
jgi:hypothetical protein